MPGSVVSHREERFFDITKKGNQFSFSTREGTIASFDIALMSGGITGAITSITMANPTVVTVANHGLATGDSVTISGTDSIPLLTGPYTVTVIDANTFSVPVNVTGAGTTGVAGGFSSSIKDRLQSGAIQPLATPITITSLPYFNRDIDSSGSSTLVFTIDARGVTANSMVRIIAECKGDRLPEPDASVVRAFVGGVNPSNMLPPIFSTGGGISGMAFP